MQITHDNIMSAVRGFEDVIDFPEGARVVSYLPMAHIAERATGHYIPIVLGHSVTILSEPARGDRLPARGAARAGSSPFPASGRS